MPHAEFHLPHSWKYFLHSPLNQLYLSLAVRAFAFSIISLFVPAYLYGELGYSLTQVFTFFIVYALTLAFSSPFFILFSTKIGFKHTIMLSIPLQMGYFYLLHILAESSFSLFWVAFVLGFLVFDRFDLPLFLLLFVLLVYLRLFLVLLVLVKGPPGSELD